MPKDDRFITVTAAAGRIVQVHPNDWMGAGIPRVTSGFIERVRWSQDIRRAIARGDLVMCDMNGARVPSAELADAPEELPGGRIAIDRSSTPTVRERAVTK